jgi:hypothetical protein
MTKSTKSKSNTKSNTSKHSTTRSIRSATRTSGRNGQQPTAPYAGVLEGLLPYKERVRLSVVEFLREEAGTTTARGLLIKHGGDRFDAKAFWREFNPAFREQYGNLPLNQLMRFARDKFGIESIADIKERRKAHITRRNQRIAALGGYELEYQENSNEFDNNDSSFDSDDDLDLDLELE